MLINVVCPDFCEGKNKMSLGIFEADNIQDAKDFVLNSENGVAPSFATRYPDSFTFTEVKVKTISKTTADHQVKHLLNQYKKYGKLIIAFDYDDTVMTFNFPEDLCTRPRELLIRAQEQGHTLVLFSSNPNVKRITGVCEFLGIFPKDNPVFQRGNKMFYNLFLDDKCGLNEACNILEETLNILEKM